MDAAYLAEIGESTSLTAAVYWRHCWRQGFAQELGHRTVCPTESQRRLAKPNDMTKLYKQCTGNTFFINGTTYTWHITSYLRIISSTNFNAQFNNNMYVTLPLNCALKLVEKIILYYDARSKKHQITSYLLACGWKIILVVGQITAHVPTHFFFSPFLARLYCSWNANTLKGAQSCLAVHSEPSRTDRSDVQCANNEVIASPVLPTTGVPTCKVVPYTPRTCRGGEQRDSSTQSEPRQFLSLIAMVGAHTHTPRHPDTTKKFMVALLWVSK